MNKRIAMTFIAGVLPVAAQQNAKPQAMPGPADYQKAVEILRGDAASNAKSAQRRRAKALESKGALPRNDLVELYRQVPLPSHALLALNLSEGWLSSGPAPVAGTDGRVLFTYGQNLPTVVCAVLQVCEIDLETGEKMSKESLDWGDHRFEVTPRAAGSGPDEFTYLVLKPTQSGLDTTMTIGTDKRPYYIRLISTDHEHMARVAFRYPEEEAAQRKADETAKTAELERGRVEAERLARLNTAKPIRNWNYQVRLKGRDAAYLRPQQIGDDGVHTHISLSEEARHRGLPIVEISDARGAIPANAHWDGNELVIDALFEHACLKEGVGRKQQRACITNQGLQDKGKAGESH